MNWLTDKTLIGVVHLPALPGSPRAELSIAHIVERAVAEARIYTDAGFDGVIVENFGDVPFHGERVEPHTAVAMGRVVTAILNATNLAVGVNVLRNDARTGLAIAAMTGARFVRINVHTGAYVTDQGLIEGRAAETLRYRATLDAEVAIFADVHVKHATPLSTLSLDQTAEETAYRGLADALIVTGSTTARPADRSDVVRVKQAVPDRPVFVGSGVTPETIAETLTVADGVIVGTALKTGGQTDADLDASRVTRFAQRAGR